MYKMIMILDNGFDLDLGLDTRYNDFMKSKTWVKAKEQGYSL